MYFHRFRASLAVAICLFLASINAAIDRAETSRGFIYYYDTIRATHVPANTDMKSSMLASYAFNAYTEMTNYRAPGPKHTKPAMVSAMWVPTDQLVIIASGAVRGDGLDYAYHPANVPRQITALLRMAAVTGKWNTDLHRLGGSCAEIVALSGYFMIFPNREGLPSPRGAKIVTVGNQGGIVGGQPVVVKPCLGTEDGGGCRDMLAEIGMRWCGPRDVLDRLKIRDSGSDIAKTNFECHGANEPPDFSNSQATYASVVTNTSTYADEATKVASVDEEEIELTATPSGYAVKTDGVTVTATSSGAISTGSSTSSTPQETGAIDASTVIGDPDKESDYCVQECVAAFKSCISGSDTDQIGSVSAMDCHAAAACYCTTPPYKTPESSTEPGSAPANPQDPATDPELLASKIDMTKVDELCTNTCQSLEAGDAKKTAPNTAPFGVEVEDASGTSFNLTDSWNCIKEAQKPGAAADAVCTIS